MPDRDEFKAEILKITGQHVDRLFDLWTHMFNTEECADTMLRLQEHANNFYNDLIAESEEKKRGIESEISELRAEAAELTRLLHKGVDIGERPTDMPLTQWVTRLDKSIEHLRDELRQRRSEICELLVQQEQLCDELAELPLPLLADPLPKAEEIADFRQHLERLRQERARRVEELYQLRKQIKQDMKQLAVLPQTDAEERLLNDPNHNLTPDTFKVLRKMQQDMAEQVAELHDYIDTMRGKIHVLWERLPEKDEYAMRQVNLAQEYTQHTYDVLSAELKRCQALRRQNLKVFIEKLRAEILEWWELTLKSEQERKRFSNFDNQWYNEDLLELHELELEDLKTYYNTNKEIFELYANRAELWSRMEALEAKAKEPNRYNNRGGQLLKEERERKALTIKLPKIEQQITELVQAYMERERSPFLVNGENILERMAADWAQRRQAKEQQSSARKHAVAPPSSATKMLPPATLGATPSRKPLTLRNMSTMSTSTMSLRKTPSQTHLASSASAGGAKTTGNMHKRKYPNSGDDQRQNSSQTPNAKRSLLSTLNSIKPAAGMALRKPSQQRLIGSSSSKSYKSPLKKVMVLANTLRRSSGLGRRKSGIGGASANKKTRPKLPTPRIQVQPASASGGESSTDAAETNDTDDTYDSFEKCIKPTLRSSVLPAKVAQRAAMKLKRPAVQLTRTNNNNHPGKLVLEDSETEEELQQQQARLPKPRRMAANASTTSLMSAAGATVVGGSSNRKLVSKDLPILI